jgi:hypothetical protein
MHVVPSGELPRLLCLDLLLSVNHEWVLFAIVAAEEYHLALASVLH